MTQGTPIDEIWKEDIFGCRKDEALYLINYIENDLKAGGKNKTININSAWGTGKTFFLKRLHKQLQLNHLCFYFNAWEDDYSENPLLSFLYKITCQLEKPQSNLIKNKKTFANFGKKLLKHGAIAAANTIGALTIGAPIGTAAANLANDGGKPDIDVTLNLAEVLDGENAYKALKFKEDSISKFKEELSNLVNKTDATAALHLPIIFIIDELDRCRPTYAIELLEAIKHIFSVDGIYFIFATDTQQLSSSIKSVYGETFDATYYLKRFFDIEFKISDPDLYTDAKILFAQIEGTNKQLCCITNNIENRYAQVFSDITSWFGLDLRGQHQCFEMLKACIFSYPSEKTHIHLNYLCFLVVLKYKNPAEF